MTRFTGREIEVVRTYAEVGTVDRTAEQLHIAPSTARNLLANARDRVDVGTTVQLVNYFSREGLLHGRRFEDDPEYMQMVDLWGRALRERDEARDTACRLEEELARRPPL